MFIHFSCDCQAYIVIIVQLEDPSNTGPTLLICNHFQAFHLRSIVRPGGKSWQKGGTGNFEVSSLTSAFHIPYTVHDLRYLYKISAKITYLALFLTFSSDRPAGILGRILHRFYYCMDEKQIQVSYASSDCRYCKSSSFVSGQCTLRNKVLLK